MPKGQTALLRLLFLGPLNGHSEELANNLPLGRVISKLVEIIPLGYL
jgi:hypothetical protein